MKGVSDMSGGNGSPRPRHYIVVVHGMGEQRHNENTVEVVNRFATARANPKTRIRLCGAVAWESFLAFDAAKWQGTWLVGV
jgi:hypothetical protein